jgi:hypothetical protein
MLPAGSLNQAISGPPPRKTPSSSMSSPLSNTTPRSASSRAVASMSSTGKFSVVYSAGTWFGFGYTSVSRPPAMCSVSMPFSSDTRSPSVSV